MITLLWRKGRGKGSGVHQMTWENGVQGIGGEGVEGESARCVEMCMPGSDSDGWGSLLGGRGGGFRCVDAFVLGGSGLC